jgi:hypothetical protein
MSALGGKLPLAGPVGARRLNGGKTANVLTINHRDQTVALPNLALDRARLHPFSFPDSVGVICRFYPFSQTDATCPV